MSLRKAEKREIHLPVAPYNVDVDEDGHTRTVTWTRTKRAHQQGRHVSLFYYDGQLVDILFHAGNTASPDPIPYRKTIGR